MSRYLTVSVDSYRIPVFTTGEFEHKMAGNCGGIEGKSRSSRPRTRNSQILQVA